MSIIMKVSYMKSYNSPYQNLGLDVNVLISKIVNVFVCFLSFKGNNCSVGTILNNCVHIL